ncbi:MAG: hypothetical protein ACKOGA_24900 [Planctomycetaceae bacterium]
MRPLATLLCPGLAVVLWLLATPLSARERLRFPYTTAVSQDRAEVLAGPGSRFYTTSRLKRGTQVTVHRHDPGGWAMIAPPPGSFSWIPASDVRVTAPGQGVVVSDKVDVRVGGSESKQRDVFQSRLFEGDTVQILGEQKLPADGETPLQRWYRIAPPRGEWRWIAVAQLTPAQPSGKSRSIIPAGGFMDEEEPAPTGSVNTPDEPGFRDPGAAPGTGSAPQSPATSPRGTPDFTDELESLDSPPPAASSTIEEPVPPPVRIDAPPSNRAYVDSETDGLRQRSRTESPTPRRATPRTTAPDSGDDSLFESQLHAIENLDREVRGLATLEPMSWDLDGLDRAYRRLQSEVSDPGLTEMVNDRLARLNTYRRVQDQRLQMREVMLQTERRDAQLVAARELGIPPNSIITPPAPVPPPKFGPLAGRNPGPNTPPPDPGLNAATPFDGAGIIAPAGRPGLPPFALVAPSGKLLAYLAPAPGVNLRSWDRREAGVVGRRVFDPRLQADVIAVTAVSPVRLMR